MTVLADATIRELYPEYRGAIGPASIDLAIGDDLRYWPDYITRDPRTDQSKWWKTAPVEDRDGPVWVLEPGLRYLATTELPIRLPDDVAGQLSARSSWGRDGLAVICGPAGWLDPGYAGRPTLELSVIGSDLILWPGAVVCQLILHHLDRPCERPYSGRYQLDTAPTPSRLWQGARP